MRNRSLLKWLQGLVHSAGWDSEPAEWEWEMQCLQLSPVNLCHIISYNTTLSLLLDRKDSLGENPKPRNSAGVSLGIINSGVSNIDGRDNNGLSTGELSTSENQFYLAVANRFSDKLSIGITAKFYYYKLYEEINTTSFGVDIGALYRVNEQFTVAVAVIDINSKYKWDSSPVYKTDGVITEDKFPNLRKIGVSYFNKDVVIFI